MSEEEMIFTREFTKNTTLFFIVLLLPLLTNAQVKIGTNATTINKNAILELETANQGLLLPRVALIGTTLSMPLTAFVEGLAVYNTSNLNDVSPGIYYSDGTKWIRQCSNVLKSVIIASKGQKIFTTPATITDTQHIRVFRNGAIVEFAKVNENQIQLILETKHDTCFAGDEIKIIQNL